VTGNVVLERVPRLLVFDSGSGNGRFLAQEVRRWPSGELSGGGRITDMVRYNLGPKHPCSGILDTCSVVGTGLLRSGYRADIKAGAWTRLNGLALVVGECCRTLHSRRA
jgi:hypothetical protein